MLTKKSRRPAPGTQRAIMEFIEKSNKGDGISKWALWLPVVTAAIAFYDWIFEVAFCYRLRLPVYLIQPTSANIFNYVLIAGIALFVIVFVYVFARHANCWMIVISFFVFVGIFDITLCIIFYPIKLIYLKSFTFEGASIWIALFFLGAMIKSEAKTASTTLSVPNLTLFILTSIWATMVIGYQLPDILRPNSRIVGKEPLVIVDRYGDEIICRYLDSCSQTYLTDKIKVFKLDGTTGFTTIRLDPAPALKKPDTLLEK